MTTFILVILNVMILVSGAQALCGAGWIGYQSSCYWFSDVEVVFQVASSICQELGGHLATVQDAGEDEFLRSQANYVSKGRQASNRKDIFWLGGTDEDTEGTWLWEDGTPVNYTNWIPGQPSNGYANANQHCLVMKDDDYEWADIDCSTNRYFICERT